MKKRKNKNLENEVLKTLINNSYLSYRLYESVLNMCGLKWEEDEVFWRMMMGVLKKRTRNHIVLTIWKNLDENQSKHLKDFIKQNRAIAPWRSDHETMMEFAKMYPKLREAIEESLEGFFFEFVKQYEKVTKV